MSKVILDGSVESDYLEITGSVSAAYASLSGVVSRDYIDIVGEVSLPKGGSYYTGDYTVTPKAHEQTTLETQGLVMTGDVVVLEIPYYETSNVHNGYTVYIGGEV